MTWADDIEHALRRGKSPWTVSDFLRWLASGQARMFVSGQLHASAWEREPGDIVVGHMAGVWNEDDARWIMRRAKAWGKERGCDSIRVEGRPGWNRFLKMKGFH